ncbi:hypothetical protein AAFF_G00116870 [Aldrovandia affinis]|uniref:Uncharacterized protein n=1 Tax=Aldrovandia affinis TaxID=143900 RepID=A0AAD7WX04_9TELE|nr:hypothetical protein AAFF_G00116870 [Aldrovandia affinis]
MDGWMDGRWQVRFRVKSGSLAAEPLPDPRSLNAMPPSRASTCEGKLLTVASGWRRSVLLDERSCRWFCLQAARVSARSVGPDRTWSPWRGSFVDPVRERTKL